MKLQIIKNKNNKYIAYIKKSAYLFFTGTYYFNRKRIEQFFANEEYFVYKFKYLIHDCTEFKSLDILIESLIECFTKVIQRKNTMKSIEKQQKQKTQIQKEILTIEGSDKEILQQLKKRLDNS